MNDNADNDPRLYAIPDIHGHAKGEHKAFSDERPIPLSARMLFLWFYHACRRGWPRFLMVTDHMNYLTFEDPAAINLVRRALKLAQAGDLYGAAETASVEVGHAAVVSEGLRRGMRYSIGAEVDNDPRSRPDAQNIVDAMKPDGMIRSVHFLTIDHATHGPNWNWPFDNPEFADVYETVGTAKTWELYMAAVLDAVERLPGNILGHFYVPAIFGHWPDDATLEAYEDQIVDACEARGMAIELNTRFLYRDHPDEEKAKYLAAHRRLLAKCKAKNVGVAVGSDAHSPKDQGRGFQTVLALLDECEINELVFPIGGRLARVALRVERKVEPPPPEAPQPPPLSDERKPVRKPRTSEVPARPKDSSSKREEATGSEAATESDDAPVTKAKPRPKRSKNRAAAPSDEVDVTAASALDDVPAPEIAGHPEPLAEEPVEADSATVEDVTDAEPVTVETAMVETAADVVTPAPIDPIVTSAADAVEADHVISTEAVILEVAVGGGAELITAEVIAPRPQERKARPKAAPIKAKTSAAAKAKVPAAKTKTVTKKPARAGVKPAAKKTPAAPAKKSAVKKAGAKKTAVKKTSIKKATPKKAAAQMPVVKKVTAKKSAVKKAVGKKPAPKRR